MTYHPQIHDALLDFLASQEASRYSDDQVERLRRLPLFPTQAGELVALAGADPVLPADTRFPAVPDMLLLKPAGARSWRSLLKRLGVGTLNHIALAERILDVPFRRLRRERRYRLLVWLRTNLDRVLADAGPNREALLQRFRSAELVQGDDGGLHAAAALYDRDAHLAREALGPLAIFPDFARTYAEEADLWQAFFRRLGSPTEPRSEDVLAYLDRLIGEAGESGPGAVADRLLALFAYVRDYWGTVAARTVLDPVSGAEDPFPRALGRRAWLPARRAPERLENFAGYVIPEDRLYCPGELYEANQGHIVASHAPIASFAQNLAKEVREGLGFPASPPLDLVLGRFEYLLDLWERDGHGGLDAKKLLTSLNAIYRYLGTEAGAPDMDSGSGSAADRGPFLAMLRDRFAARACLWDREGQRFWLPAHTFAVPVPFFGPARATLAFREDPINAAYEALGRRAAVGAADLTTFLAECAVADAGGVLPEVERANVLLVLGKLAEEHRRPDAMPEPCPLLSQDGRLLPPSLLFDDDDPYHRPFLHEDVVHLVDRRVPWSLCRTMGVQSLAEILEERMAEEPRIAADEALTDACRRIAAILHSGEFPTGILRLLQHHGADTEGMDLAWLRRLEIIPTDPFTIELWLRDKEVRRVGEMDGSFFFEPGTKRVYVAADSSEFIRDDLARAINRRLGGAIGDLSPLIRILGSEPARIDALLTRLRITRMRAEPRPGERPEVAIGEDSLITFAPDTEEDTMEEVSLGAGFHVFAQPESGEECWEDAAGAHDEEGGQDAADVHRQGGWEDSVDAHAEGREDVADERAARLRVDAEPYSGEGNGEEHSPDGRIGDAAGTTQSGTGAGSGPSPVQQRAAGGGPSSASPASRAGGVARADSNRPVPRPLPDPARATPGTNDNGAERPPRSAPEEGAHGASSGRPLGGHGSGSGSWKSRVVTYLRSGTAYARNPDDANNDDLPENRHIGEAAEAFAHEEEQRLSGRVVTRMPHYNPGFDILSETADGTDRKYIEVKGLKGEWGGAGVPLSARQFEQGWVAREAFWVYVVEHALDPARRRITRIRNPVGNLTEYRLDHRWRDLGS